MNKLYFQSNYGILPKNVMKDKDLSIGAKGLFAYLCAYAGSENHSFPNRDLIIYELSISKDTFTKYMKELKEIGYITVEQHKNKGKFDNNVYYITPENKIEKDNSPRPKFSDTESSDTKKQDITNNNITNNNNINKKEKEKKKTTFDKLIDEHTSNVELKETLIDFIIMRKTIKKPMTDKALKLLLNKLNKYAANDDNKKIYMLNESIEHSWQTVYEPKDYIKDTPKKEATPKVVIDDNFIKNLESDF